jgi:outer membrane protein assembly factor BamD
MMDVLRGMRARRGVQGLVLGLAVSTAAWAQDAQPAGTTAPDATVSNAPARKTRTRKTREEKKEEKVVQSKDTKKSLKRLSRDNPLAGVDSTQPDKQLYDKAMASIKRGHFDVSRLELQTLLATYPDSEYMMRAKLAFADSWYREGGTAAMAQAETEYKDFITFFPNAPEAAEAQMRVGDIYFKQMDTPDRDYTKSVHAQEEYRTMLQQFPDSPLVPDAKQRLREVQEVMATREADIAAFYAGRENWAASIARYQSVADMYPLYSRADEVLIGLGDAYAAQARIVRGMKLPEGAKARLVTIYDDQAASAYNRVATQYAAAPHAEDARDRLELMGRPIPQPTEEQMAASQALENSRQTYHLKDRMKLLVFRGPDTVQASRLGDPSLADPKATNAPTIARQTQEDFRLALNPGAAPASTGTPLAVPAGAAPAAVESSAVPAATGAPSLSDIPAADAPAAGTGSAVDMSTPAAAPAASGGSVGVEILSPGATTTPTKTKDLGNGLKAVGPANTEALPAVEKPESAPDQVNDVAGQQTPVGQAAPAKGKAKPDFDKSGESDSKHRKKKGLGKLNPF